MLALLAEYGQPLALAAVEGVLDGAERQARACIAEWKDGVYRGEAIIDDDGHGFADIRIRATVTKRGSDVTVDLSDSHPQVHGFINSSYPNMRAAVCMALAYLIDPHTPKNDGAFRSLSVVAREGTVVWARPPAPVTLCTNHCAQEIMEAVIKALAPACPDRAMAGWGRRFRIAIQGEDPRTGRPFIWHMFHARPGGGASSAGDGWPTAGEWQAAGGIKFGSVEVTEVRFPLFFRRHEFRADSGGDGRYRGGVGTSTGAGGRDRPARAGPTPRVMACAMAPAASSAGPTGCPITTCSSRAAGPTGCSGPRRSASPSTLATSSSRVEAGAAAAAAARPRAGPPASSQRARAPTRGDELASVGVRDERAAEPREAPTEWARPACTGSASTSEGPSPTPVAVDDAGRVMLAKAASTPADPSIGVMDGVERPGRGARHRRGPAPRRDRAHRARHHRRHQRAPRAQRRQRGPSHHRGPPRRDRDARGPEGRPLQPAHAAPEPLAPRARRLGVRERMRADGTAAVALDARSLDRAIAAPQPRAGRGGRGLLPPCLPRSPRTRRRRRKALAARPAGGVRVPLLGGAPADQGVRARLDHRGQRLRGPGPVALPDAPGASACAPPATRARADHAVPRRRGADRARRCAWPRAPCCRARPAGSRAAATARACSARANLIPFDMGGTSTDISLIVDGEPSSPRDRGVAGHRVALPQPRHREPGGRRRLHCAGSMPAGSSRWARRARAPSPGRPATAGAGPRPPSPMPTWCSATSIPATFSAAGGASIAAAAERAVNASPDTLGTDRMAAADGIHRVVNTRMAEGIRLVSVRRGVDPRRFSAARLRRRGRTARYRCGAPARDPAGGRAARGRGALGVGHARHRPALRGCAHPYRRHAQVGAAALRPRVRARWRREGRRRLEHAFTGPVRISARWTCATASRSSRSSVPLDGVELEAAGADGRGRAPLPSRATRSSTPTALPDQEAVLVNARLAVVGELPDLPEEPPLPARRPRRRPGPGAASSWARLGGGARPRPRCARRRARRSTGRRSWNPPPPPPSCARETAAPSPGSAGSTSAWPDRRSAPG